MQHINKHIERYGKNLKGEPLYRLVWSDDQREWRQGTFNDYFGDLFIREVTDTRLMPKYPHIKERWILERWCPPEIAFSPELPNSTQGSYEPVYVFESSKRIYLEPNIRVCEFIINQAENPVHDTVHEKINRLKEKEEKEIQAIYDELDLRSDIGFSLLAGEAVGYEKSYADKIKSEDIN